MKNKLLIVIATVLLFFPKVNFGQIVLGPAASKFAIFTASGAVGDNASAHSHVIGDVGTNTASSITNFGNVNGVMHNGTDAATTACATALATTIGQITSSTSTLFPSGTMGGGVTFDSGVYSISGNATLGGNLILDAQGNPNAQFIIKISGTFAASTNAKVLLTNGALACNVYWKIVGAVTIASTVTLRGNFISNAAISLGSGDSLEGRILTTVGAIGIDGTTIFTPIGCSSPTLTGPTLPNLASTACYTIFSSIGALANTVGTTTVIGDVGKNSNGSSITGWTAGAVTGALHSTQDASTILCASDLQKLYDTLNAMVPDITLLYPAQFGHNLTLTPHVYIMNSAATFTDSLYLDAQNNPNGVFVIKIGGALSTSTYCRVKLINGAQSKNVFWMVQGQVDINNYSIFRGTIVVSSGAINLLNTGVVLDGRALTITGAITTAGLTAVMPPGCGLGSNITSQPINDTICAGSPARFSVVVTGTGLTYQWRKGTVNITNGGNISGATSDTLRINPANVSDTASNYNVIATGSSQHDTSNNAALIVNTAPIIISQPINQSVCAAGSARFSVVAKGTGLTYQWRKGNANLINGVNISGATSDTLRINSVSVSDTSSYYNVVITGTCAPIDTSNKVSLLINSNTIINNQPVNKSACAGNSVKFSVVAIGAGLTYQWRKGNVNLTNAGNISGATSDTLTINPMSISDTSTKYYVIISSACSPNDTSNNASLSANTITIITSQPVNKTACTGSSVKFSVVATGSGLTYQWRKGIVNLNNGGNISGATSDTLTINPMSISDTSTKYYVIISGTCSANDTSNNASLSVNTATIITSQPVNKTACSGSSVKFSVVANGSGLTYQWRKGIVNLTNAGNISGATSDTLNINPVSISDTSTNYYVIISGTCSANDTSSSASLILNTSPIITTAPANQVACPASSASFSVTANGTGLTYQWRKGIVNLTNGVNISGATSSILTINPVGSADTASNYNVVITGTCSPNVTSANVSLRFSTGIIINTQPANQTPCSGSSTSFSVSATGAGLTYQWRKGNVNLINGVNISGATSASLTINPANISDNAINYNVIISSTCSPNDTSNNTSLTVTPTPVAIASSNSPVCTGSSINLNAQTVTGATYQWTGPNAYSSAIQNPIIVISTLANAGSYSLTVSMNGCNSIPSVAIVVVNNCDSSDLSVVKTVNNARPMVGTNVIFTIVATNNGPNTAKGITVGDTLQSGYTFVSATATKGTYDPATGIWSIDTLYNGTSATLTLTATVNAAGIYKNTATIKGIGVDKNPINNISWVETFPSDFFIPQGFSPNGDGINDLFVIRGIQIYPNNTFTIFNRWGNEVFTASPYNNTWDGTTTMGLRVGGNQLPVGTYFYILDLGDGSNIIKGTIYLNK